MSSITGWGYKIIYSGSARINKKWHYGDKIMQ